MKKGWSTGLSFVLIGVTYFAVAFIGLRLASINPSATPIWPATGVAIAVMLWRGYSVALAIFIATSAVNYLTAGSISASLAIATGNTLEAAATVALARAFADGDRVFEFPAGVGKFALISAATTTVSATIGVGALLLTGLETRSNAAPVWLTWWLGDFAGALVVTPAMLLWLKADKKSVFHDQMIAINGTAIIVGVIAFSPLIPAIPLRDPLGFLCIAPLLWAALRSGPRDTATTAAILAGFAVWGTLTQSGPFARPTLNDSFLLLLMFMISTAIPSLALSADIAARRLAQTHQELLLRELSHRVGNTLAVLSSVFRRSALHARSIAELKESFEGRLMNLATTNRLLGLANWQSASLKELVQAAVEPYCPPEYDGCEFTGIELRIPGSIVTSLTMVLHELAVNAAKHGALKSRDGKLRRATQMASSFALQWARGLICASSRLMPTGLGMASQMRFHERWAPA